MNYYNDTTTGEWLHKLIDRKLIPDGVVDTRSVAEIKPIDLEPFTQCHFFAGIGGWSRALALANFPTDQQIWTGSCPCQPFSQTGLLNGFSSDKHLWPAWFHLISVCKPAIVVGEQVASGPGLEWLDVVLSNLENEGYTCGAADLCAASVGVPHIRQRLWFVASRLDNADSSRLQRQLWTTHSCRPDAATSLPHDLGLFSDGLRPIQPGISVLGNGFSTRMGRISGFGNAIVPMVGARFIKGALDALSEWPRG